MRKLIGILIAAVMLCVGVAVSANATDTQDDPTSVVETTAPAEPVEPTEEAEPTPVVEEPPPVEDTADPAPTPVEPPAAEPDPEPKPVAPAPPAEETKGDEQETSEPAVKMLTSDEADTPDVDPNVPTSEQPEPLEEVTIDREFACDGETLVASTELTSLTPYKWDANAQQWVLDPDNATVHEGERIVHDDSPPTCDGPTTPAPAPETETNVVDREYACDGETVVAYTEQTITTPYRWNTDSQEWELDFDAATTTEKRTEVDGVDVDCSTDVPTVTDPPVKDPPAPSDPQEPSTPAPVVDEPDQANTSTMDTLPQTGSDLGPLVGIGVVLLVLGSTLIFFSRKSRS